MSRYYVGLFLTALTTLLVELNLTRIFDVLLGANLAYMIITCAIFAFGLSGIYAMMIPQVSAPGEHLDRNLGRAALYLALSLLFVVLVVNVVPAEFLRPSELRRAPWRTLASYGALYLAILGPFFFAGLIGGCPVRC